LSQAPPPPPPPPPPAGGVPATPAGGAAPPPGNPLVGYWKQVVLERYTKFDGRSGRPEFWWYVLANFIISIVLNLVSQVSDILVILPLLYGLAVLIPGIAVAIRRLHDTGKSGWFLLLGLIPCAGPIILIVFFATEGTRGPNQFGVAAE